MRIVWNVEFVYFNSPKKVMVFNRMVQAVIINCESSKYEEKKMK